MNEQNVISFEPRRALVLEACELRLDPETYGLEMTLIDDGGSVFILSFALESKPRDFDLRWLAESWSRWRDSSAVTS